MEMQTFNTHHLVKEADLNHHGTLYAGRGADWIVESSFIAASSLTTTKSIVCLKIHGMLFLKPVPLGSLLRFESKIVHAGKTSLTAYTRVVFAQTNEFIVDAYITFIHINPATSEPTPHGLTIEAKTPEEKVQQEQVITYLKK